MTLSPLRAIRESCKDCSDALTEIRYCEFTRCALYPYRMGKNPYRGKEKPPTYKPPLKAIRAYCLDCCLGQSKEVRLCPVIDCTVHPFRFGKNPFASEAKRNQGRNFNPKPKNSRFVEGFQAISVEEYPTSTSEPLGCSSRQQEAL